MCGKLFTRIRVAGHWANNNNNKWKLIRDSGNRYTRKVPKVSVHVRRITYYGQVYRGPV